MQNTNPVRPGSRHSEAPASATHKPEKKPANRGPLGWIAFGVAILVIIILTIVAIGLVRNQPVSSKMKAEVNKNQYQAVFLTNGQVYFGRIKDIAADYLQLEKIYYLQIQEPVQPSDKNKPQQNLSLLKLGSEIHGPEDEMIINKEQILFWENIQDGSKVVQAIKQAEK